MKGAQLDSIYCKKCDYCEQNLITGKWYCQMDDDRRIEIDKGATPGWCPTKKDNDDNN